MEGVLFHWSCFSGRLPASAIKHSVLCILLRARPPSYGAALATGARFTSSAHLEQNALSLSVSQSQLHGPQCTQSDACHLSRQIKASQWRGHCLNLALALSLLTVNVAMALDYSGLAAAGRQSDAADTVTYLEQPNEKTAKRHKRTKAVV